MLAVFLRFTARSRRLAPAAGLTATTLITVACGHSPTAPAETAAPQTSIAVTPAPAPAPAPTTDPPAPTTTPAPTPPAPPPATPAPAPVPLPAPPPPPLPPALPLGFDAKSLQQARALGVAVSYGTAWAGAWNQKYGWSGLEREVQQARAAGATPVIPWLYWSDDISVACVENGCIDRYQGVPKDRATWTRLSGELADLAARSGGAGTIIVIEPEFNKNGIESYEAFDGYLAEQAAIFHKRGLQVVISFGNWGKSRWTSFDRAVASADLVGTMALQSSVRDSGTYMSGADQLISAARYLQSTFGKAVLVYDVGFSSYPEPGYEANQDAVVAEIFRRMSELRAAGVVGVIWRMLADDPGFDTSNYHGVAERYWGLLHASGAPKQAFRWFVPNH